MVLPWSKHFFVQFLALGMLLTMSRNELYEITLFALSVWQVIPNRCKVSFNRSFCAISGNILSHCTICPGCTFCFWLVISIFTPVESCAIAGVNESVLVHV